MPQFCLNVLQLFPSSLGKKLSLFGQAREGFLLIQPWPTLPAHHPITSLAIPMSVSASEQSSLSVPLCLCTRYFQSGAHATSGLACRLLTHTKSLLVVEVTLTAPARTFLVNTMAVSLTS